VDGGEDDEKQQLEDLLTSDETPSPVSRAPPVSDVSPDEIKRSGRGASNSGGGGQ
jgi:hypothetical protein